MDCETLCQKVDEIALEESAAQKALATNTVLRQVFRCLGVTDLVKFSILNKTWNYEARCVLRNERKVIASLKGQESCNKAKLLNEQLGRMTVIFYNGLSVEPCVTYCPYNTKLGIQNMKDVLGKIMKMPLKFLEINWKGGNCLLGQLASTFLRRSLTLEYLNIVMVPLDKELWTAQEINFQGDQDEPGLPKLKTLEISNRNEEYMEDFFETNFLSEMTSRAVNLEELKLKLDMDLYQLVPVEYVKLIKSDFGIATASVALATFYTYGVLSITPAMVNQMLKIGHLYAEKLEIRPATKHATAVELINKYGKMESKELSISTELFFVEMPTFKGKLGNNSSVFNAFDSFCSSFLYGIVNVDWKYVCVELAEQVECDYSCYIFDPVGNGSLRANGNVKKATIVRCSRNSLSDYLINVFAGASTMDFTITPVIISKIIEPGREFN